MNEKELFEIEAMVAEPSTYGWEACDRIAGLQEDCIALIAEVRRLQSELAQRDPAWRG